MRFVSPLLAALGACGAGYTLFSYFGEGALPYALATACLTLVLALGLSLLSAKQRPLLLAGLLFVLLALPLLAKDTFLPSALSAAIPLIEK